MVEFVAPNANILSDTSGQIENLNVKKRKVSTYLRVAEKYSVPTFILAIGLNRVCSPFRFYNNPVIYSWMVQSFLLL